MGLAHSPSVVTDGLVLYLDAGNTKSYPGSGTAWTDLSGRGNNGTLTNGPTYSLDNGGVILMDRSDDFAHVPISLSSGNTTYEIVMKSNSSIHDVFGAGTPPQVETNVIIQYYSTYSFLRVYGTVGGPSGWQTEVTVNHNNVTLSANNFYHFAFTNSESNWNFYVNGNLVGQTNYYQPIFGTGIKIGDDAMQGVSSTTTVIGLSRAYNRVLSHAEIAQNFAATRGRFGL